MKLVIAEKPSVAQSIAAVLGVKERKDGYLEGKEYLVSWCFGHLVELANADAYDPKYAKWNYEDLPIMPKKWKYSVPDDKTKQLSILKSLMNRKDVELIICATDAGREGQLIFQLVYDRCGCNKPVKRLWINSMEEGAIREGFEHLKNNASYDDLYQAALSRSKADWIVGINASRLFSVLYRQPLNIGRVQTPTLAMVVNRETDIETFKPELFYAVEIDCGSFTAVSERIKDKIEADILLSACTGKNVVIESVEKKKKSEQPPKLFDLTSLQRDANRIFGYTAKETLDYTQLLYEKKLVTYPRTDSRYLTDDMEKGLPEAVKKLMPALSFAKDLQIPVYAKQVTDSSKVSDHTALIPTASMPASDLNGLTKAEKDILYLISARLLISVGEPYEYEETAVKLSCADHEFTARGKTLVSEGWKKIDQAYRDFTGSREGNSEKEADAGTGLPALAEGQEMSCKASEKEGKTTPPKHFTEDTLLNAMENAGAKDMPNDAERKGLGTPATRAGILEKLVKVGYLTRSGENKTKALLPTRKGIALITVAPEAVASASLTAEWEQKLKEVEKGKIRPEEFLTAIEESNSSGLIFPFSTSFKIGRAHV